MSNGDLLTPSANLITPDQFARLPREQQILLTVVTLIGRIEALEKTVAEIKEGVKNATNKRCDESPQE